MARISLQIKNVASLVLSLAASVSAAVSVRRYFEHGNLWTPVTCVAAALGWQIALLFIESKEEEELSLIRTARLDRTRHAMAEKEKITQRIQREIDAGDVESADRWHRFRETL